MITVETDGGDTFTGADARAVVRQMKNAAWNAPDKKRDYMAQVADRVEQMTGQRPPRGAGPFLADLERQGLVRIAHQDDATPVETLAEEEGTAAPGEAPEIREHPSADLVRQGRAYIDGEGMTGEL